MIRLIIKGPKTIAVKAAKARGITVTKCKEVSGSTVAYAREETRPQVIQWFGESEQIKPGEGFPNGTLLLY